MYTRLYVLRHRKSISCRPFIFSSFPVRGEKHAALPIVRTIFVAIIMNTADSLLSFPLLQYTHTHWHIVRSPTFSVGPRLFFLFFRGSAVSHSAAAIRYIWSSRYTRTYIYIHISFSHSGFPSAHETNASAILLSSLVNFIK